MDSYPTLLVRTRTFFDKFLQVERYICSVLLMIVTALTFVQVTMRFLFSAPFSWSEEVTLMFLVWFGYLCMAIDIYTDDHAALYFLYNKMGPRLRKSMDFMRHGLLTFFFGAMIYYGYLLTKLNYYKYLPASKISQWVMYAPLMVGGLLMMIYSALNFLSVLFTPITSYYRDKDHEKTIEELTVERGGTV